jgi:peptidyl-prolyl cis-trans isomerase B (cyclophilin B)
MTAADDTPQRRTQQTNPLAIMSVVSGMVALVLGPLAILAIVSGHIARRQIRRTGEGGRGMATAGLILGYMVLVVGITLLAVFLASLHGPVFHQGLAVRRA